MVKKPARRAPNTPIPTDLITPSGVKSPVWLHFKVSPSEPGFAFCCVPQCKSKNRRIVHSSSATTNLHAHLQHHHSAIANPSAEAASSLRSLLTRQAAVASKSRCSNAVSVRMDKLVLEYFVDNCLPFNVADSNSFVSMVNYAASGFGHYIPPGRTKLTASVDLLYRQMMDALLLDLSLNAVAITTDSVTLSNGRSFLAVTGHYITPSFELRDVTLRVQRLEGRHTSDYVSELLDHTVSAWQAEGRVFAAVTDNGANFVKAATIATQISNTSRCACHTMQLALKDSVSAQPSLSRITLDAQKLVKAIRRSGLLVEHLDALQRTEHAADVLISVAAAEELEPPPDPSDRRQALRLIQHVTTRFNSVCMLLSRLYDLRAPVDRLCLTEREKLKGKCITGEQWNEIGELLSVLLPVKEVCDQLEASTCPSIGLIIPLIAQLADHLAHDIHPSLSIPSCQAVCDAVKVAIVERMRPVFNDHAAMCAMMLDPRVRTKQLPSWAGEKRAAVNQLQIMFSSYPQTHSTYVGAAHNTLLRHSQPAQDAAHMPANEIAAHGQERPAKRRRVVLAEESESSEDRQVAEIDLYLKEPGIRVDECPLKWWKEREMRYPVLSQTARVYLAIPASSAPAERVFSAGTLVLTDKRRRLGDERIAQLIWMKKNMDLYCKLKE